MLIAKMYADLGDRELALSWLAKAIEQRNVFLLYLNTSELWDPFRSNPRFIALFRRLNFPPRGR